MVKRIVSFILAAGLAFGAAELPKTGIRVSGHSAAPGQTEFTDYYFDDYGIKYSTKNLAAASVTGLGAKVYTGKAIKPSPVVKMGSTVLKRKVDYKVTYKANKNIGTAKLTIKGIGKYKGSISKTFKAIPHEAGGADAPSGFSSDRTEIPQAYCRMSRDFCAR